MIVSAHQPAYNPWLGYIHKILLCDIFVVMDDVQFEKNSFINRNKILQNCNEHFLTIPIHIQGHTKKSIKDIKVANVIWKKKHLKSIKQAYIKSPYFDIVYSNIESILLHKSDFLIDYNNLILEFLSKYLSIQTKIVYASSLNISGKKLDYVIELTQKIGGDIFIFGANGKDYADQNKLKSENIKYIFQNYNHPIYHQQCKEFHPYMGIFDILFNENPKDITSIITYNNLTKNRVADAVQ